MEEAKERGRNGKTAKKLTLYQNLSDFEKVT
jgi:hypothetical protein